ncbi:MAG: SPFH domain-containing protein [Oscillospiraceae bacterium]|nr:SPFH domain-containing protein [Oscillospiraceae bacterium]
MTDNKKKEYEEKEIKASNGMAMLMLFIILYIGSLFLTIYGAMDSPFFMIIGILYLCLGWIPFMGLKVIRPNEALVLTLFGKYTGTLKKEGFFYVNPFSIAVNPTVSLMNIPSVSENGKLSSSSQNVPSVSKKVSLKATSLVNSKQKINDEMGNPIEVGIIVIWKVINTAKAVFNVDNYKDFISTQADSALRDVVRQYPYDVSGNGDEASLRGSSQEVAEHLKRELQKRVDIAGIEIMEARITHLAYAPEIAAAMLQRQQASAIIEARQKIVDGAVGMVEMALNKLNENQICELDEERKAAMVSNLLVVLCGNKDAQPIVNSGSIY